MNYYIKIKWGINVMITTKEITKKETKKLMIKNQMNLKKIQKN